MVFGGAEHPSINLIDKENCRLPPFLRTLITSTPQFILRNDTNYLLLIPLWQNDELGIYKILLLNIIEQQFIIIKHFLVTKLLMTKKKHVDAT